MRYATCVISKSLPTKCFRRRISIVQKQGCLAVGIHKNTLRFWREKHPELEERMSKAREKARQRALSGIKRAVENGDWRALAEFLRLSFPEDYRRASNASVEMNTAVQAQGVS